MFGLGVTEIAILLLVGTGLFLVLSRRRRDQQFDSTVPTETAEPTPTESNNPYAPSRLQHRAAPRQTTSLWIFMAVGLVLIAAGLLVAGFLFVVLMRLPSKSSAPVAPPPPVQVAPQLDAEPF